MREFICSHRTHELGAVAFLLLVALVMFIHLVIEGYKQFKDWRPVIKVKDFFLAVLEIGKNFAIVALVSAAIGFTWWFLGWLLKLLFGC